MVIDTDLKESLAKALEETRAAVDRSILQKSRDEQEFEYEI